MKTSPETSSVAGKKETQIEESPEGIYVAFFGVLFATATRRHKVPDDDAESLVHDVFVCFLARRKSIRDVRGWLIAAVRNASCRYWQRQVDQMHVPLDESIAAAVVDHEIRLTIRKTVNEMHEKSAALIHLHYWLGATAREMADEYGTTLRYAEKLIHQSLQEAKETYRELAG